MRYAFGPFLADRTTYRLTRGGTTVELTPKLLDLLFHFLEHPATLVTKEALLDAVWPRANVTENALAQAVSDLREALGDEPAAPTYIRTVARRGYRFVAPVEPATPTPTSAPAAAPGADATGRQTLIVLDFENVTGDAEVAWLSAGIAETVTSDLAAIEQFRVVDRWRTADAARTVGGSLAALTTALGATLVVTGSFQRSGSQLRITARLVDVGRGEALADAKVDGRLQDVFSLQDGIVGAFARALGMSVAPRAERQSVRDTGSLEAYRAYTEGWLKIESLDTTIVDAAIADFERAIGVDPQYAIAYTGLANAEFVAYEMTRATTSPNTAALSSGVAHARHAVALDDRLAEAHATLSFLLSSVNEFDDARRAAQRAVVLEPENWRHQYRLAHAWWGETRLRSMDRALALYPRFAYAHFERAMVFVARGDLDTAAGGIRRAAEAYDRPGHAGERFPGIGFHWLLGAIAFQQGDVSGAIAAFDRELALINRRRLYGPEYAALTFTARGHAELALGEPGRALASYEAALGEIGDYPRALAGIVRARQAQQDGGRAADTAAELQRVLDVYRQQRRDLEVLYVSAGLHASRGERAEAATCLDRFLDASPASALGWTIPIEPLFRPLHGDPGFARVLTRLADRGR